LPLKYTQSQQEAVETVGQNLQIIACAGSGKTEVVSARIVTILKEMMPKGIMPRNIVAFTFTDKAAAELKSRIALLCRNELGEVNGLAEMYVGTIHGFCLELLQTYMYKFLKFSVLNEVQARLLVDRNSVKSGMKDLGLRRYKDSSLYLEVLEVVREAETDMAKLRGHPVLEALKKYDDLLNRKAYLDYTKIMKEAVDGLLNDKELREKIRERVKYLIVDEYQDINPLQEELIRQLGKLGANVCVVGDDDQAIYEWRGTEVANILTFEKRYPRVKVAKLEENFRSSKGIVDTATQVIERNNPSRLQKKMRSSYSQAFDRGDILALSFSNPDEEAAWITSKIRSLAGVPFCDKAGDVVRGLSWSDFAILLRSVRNNGAPILQALNTAGIPYVVLGMNDLFDTPEVQAARGIFLFMADQMAEPELRKAWIAADTGVSSEKLGIGIEYLKAEKKFDKAKRFGLYNLQRLFLEFLQLIEFQERKVPSDRGEMVYYNLGKFSQVISDFEQINFHSDPKRKYDTFAGFLIYEAPEYYPEGWEDASFAVPDAVQIMTVHQAKGMEWPVVFVPAILGNRFPSKKQGGRNVWHVIPREAVRGADRYDGGIESERRLFYVALTRSKKYLFASWAPVSGNQLYSRPSPFFQELTRTPVVLTRDPKHEKELAARLPQQPRAGVTDILLSFSELKYFFICPYQFKLRFKYGFNPPIHEALGFGRSLHNALAEIHKRFLDHEVVSEKDISGLLDIHLHLPFAYPKLKDQLRASAEKALKGYLDENGENLDKVQHVEQVVEVQVSENVVVNGRIDLIKKLDTGEVSIVDFKSSERAQPEDVTREQLHVYAVGYEQLTGKDANLVEVYNLDNGGSIREEVDRALVSSTKNLILGAADKLRQNKFPLQPKSDKECSSCDMRGICPLGRESESLASWKGKLTGQLKFGINGLEGQTTVD
jgi:ATP-dependent DNA helicase UvrD/PcrA